MEHKCIFCNKNTQIRVDNSMVCGECYIIYDLIDLCYAVATRQCEIDFKKLMEDEYAVA